VAATGFAAGGAAIFAGAGFFAAGARRAAGFFGVAGATASFATAVAAGAGSRAVSGGVTTTGSGVAATASVCGGTPAPVDFGPAFRLAEGAGELAGAGEALPGADDVVGTDFGAERFFCDIYLRGEK